MSRIMRRGAAYTGLVAVFALAPIASDADAADGLALLRESYDEQRARSATATPTAN